MGKEFDVVQLGTSHVDEETGAPVAQAVNPIGEDETDVEQHGDVDLMCALGVTALPAPKTKAGVAEGVILKGCGGTEGVCVGARDTRSNKVVGELAPGETCLHSTGDGFDSRVFCKEELVSIVVGNDIVMTLDRAAKKIQIAGFGAMFEMSEAQGIVLCAPGGKAMIQLKDDQVWIKAPKILIADGNAGAFPAVHTGGAALPPGVPSTAVMIGA